MIERLWKSFSLLTDLQYIYEICFDYRLNEFVEFNGNVIWVWSFVGGYGIDGLMNFFCCER